MLRGVNFDFNSSTIRPDSRPVLDQAATLLKANPGVQVLVEGYTDSIGSDEYNQALSLRRAEAVYRYLVNHGVDPERLTVEGFGKRSPVASNDTEAGRAQNRRVELHPVQSDDAVMPRRASVHYSASRPTRVMEDTMPFADNSPPCAAHSRSPRSPWRRPSPTSRTGDVINKANADR